MRHPEFQFLLLVGCLCFGTLSARAESGSYGKCAEINSRFECTDLGALLEPTLLAGTLRSCSKSSAAVPLGSEEASESAVVYQFDLPRRGFVQVHFVGLGEALFLRNDRVVFRVDETVARVRKEFGPGHYTLIGRAPNCSDRKWNRNGGYKIQIHPFTETESEALKSTSGIEPVVVLTREKRTSARERLVIGAMWVFMIPLGLFLLYMVAAIFSGGA